MHVKVIKTLTVLLHFSWIQVNARKILLHNFHEQEKKKKTIKNVLKSITKSHLLLTS